MANKQVDQLLSGCLYFTANHLARVINRMAEEEFGKIGLSPNIQFPSSCDTGEKGGNA